MEAGCEAIEGYRKQHLVADEIDAVLAEFIDSGHAGDGGALFYVSVYEASVEA